MQSIGDYVADEYRGMHATTYWKPDSMKLLIFSDLHCHVEMAQSIVSRAEDADVIIVLQPTHVPKEAARIRMSASLLHFDGTEWYQLWLVCR